MNTVTNVGIARCCGCCEASPLLASMKAVRPQPKTQCRANGHEYITLSIAYLTLTVIQSIVQLQLKCQLKRQFIQGIHTSLHRGTVIYPDWSLEAQDRQT